MDGQGNEGRNLSSYGQTIELSQNFRQIQKAMALYNSPEMQKLLKVQETIEKYNIPEMQATMAKHDIPALREIQRTANLLNSSLPRNALKAQSIICFAQQYPWILRDFPNLSNDTKAFLNANITMVPKDTTINDDNKHIDNSCAEPENIQIRPSEMKVQHIVNSISKEDFPVDKEIDTSIVKNQLEEFICVTNEASNLVPVELKALVKEVFESIFNSLRLPKIQFANFLQICRTSAAIISILSGATLIENLVNFETNVTLNKTEVTQIENNNTNDIIVIQSNPQITINGDVENPQDVIDQCLKRQAELFADIIEAALQNE